MGRGKFSIRGVCGWQMTELSSAVQPVFISTRFHAGVSIFNNQKHQTTKP
jgi:hypothetical protein